MDPARHFGLSRMPFTRLGGHEEPIAGGPYTRAYEEALAALSGGRRLLVIVGSRGAGKTLLLQNIGRLAAAEGRRIAQAAGGELPADAVAAQADLLLVDDADQLPEQALDALASRAAAPVGPVVVLAGLRRGLARLRRIARPTIIELADFEPDEARTFIVEQIERAGGRAELFGRQALDLIVTAANGSARRLSSLAGIALMHAAQEGARSVNQAHAKRAIDVADAIGPMPLAVEQPGQSVPPQDVAEEPSPPVEAPRQAYRLSRPLAALAILVGLILLALPLIGRLASTDQESQRMPAAAPASAPASPPAAGVRPAEATKKPATAAVDEVPSEPERPIVEDAVPAAPAPAASVTAADGNADADAEPAVTARQPAPAAGRRVFIHYTRGAPGAEEAAARLASALEEAGYMVADIRGVPIRISRASTRFFFREDEGVATTLNRRIGRARLIDMTDYPRPPRRGTIEVWLPAR